VALYYWDQASERWSTSTTYDGDSITPQVDKTGLVGRGDATPRRRPYLADTPIASRRPASSATGTNGHFFGNASAREDFAEDPEDDRRPTGSAP